MIEEIEAYAISRRDFDPELDDDDDMSDDMIASWEDTWSVWFDYNLDDLEGPCAAMVRLARFSAWGQQYEHEIIHKIRNADCVLSEPQWSSAKLAPRITVSCNAPIQSLSYTLRRRP